MNGRSTTFVLFYQTLAAIFFNFLQGSDDYHNLFIFYILLCSLIVFLLFYYISPFHKENVSFIWACGSAINLWTAIMLVFAHVIYFIEIFFKYEIVYGRILCFSRCFDRMASRASFFDHNHHDED